MLPVRVSSFSSFRSPLFAQVERSLHVEDGRKLRRLQCVCPLLTCSLRTTVHFFYRERVRLPLIFLTRNARRRVPLFRHAGRLKNVQEDRPHALCGHTNHCPFLASNAWRRDFIRQRSVQLRRAKFGFERDSGRLSRRASAFCFFRAWVGEFALTSSTQSV